MPPFHPHPILFLGLVVAGSLHAWAVGERRLRRRAVGGWLILALVVLWPVGDLAASVSLSVATMQRLIIMLAVAPLLLSSLSTSHLIALTRPAPIDAVARRVARPLLSITFVTVVGTLTLSTPVVDEGAQSPWIRLLTLGAVLACGVVLWIPAFAVMPGAARLSPVGRAAFIFVSSIVVTSLSLVWIFARHSLYPSLHGQESFVHMTPLLDQQVAGFIAKLGSYLPLWAVAFFIFSRADEAGTAVDESPLHWADVERELLRVDRQRAHARRRAGRES